MKKLAISLTLCGLLIGTSCVGSYRAFNSLASWNTRATDSKWLNELINLGLYIIPVYELFFMADSLVINSIEFWTGKNPLNEPKPFNEGSDKPAATDKK